MDKKLLLSILDDWNFWNHDLKTGLERTGYLGRLERLIQTNQVVVVTGPRRAGKSFVMRQMIKRLTNSVHPSQTLMVNFEDPRFEKLDSKTLDQIFHTYMDTFRPKQKPFLFLDEIQEVEGWEKWVRMMHELDKAKIIISGSNARLLSRELATLLTGRHLSLTIFPFSFEEQIQAIPHSNEMDMIHYQRDFMQLLHENLEFGSFPEVTQTSVDERKKILLHYYDDILNKDLIRRYKIRKSEHLKSLARYYFGQQGSLVTYNSIEKFLHLSADTIEKFSTYFEESYLFFFVKRFSFKIKEQENSPRKVYAVDTGLANTIGFRSSPNWGRLMEGLVFLHLLRKKADDPEFEIFYWKDNQHREVDFVIKNGLKVNQLVQVSYLSEEGIESDPSQFSAKERETNSLLLGMKALKQGEGVIITESYEALEEKGGFKIYFIPLWKWLLEK